MVRNETVVCLGVLCNAKSRVNPRMIVNCQTVGVRHVASVLTRNIRELQGTPLQQFVLGHARAAASWLPQAYDGAHLPRLRTSLSGLPAGWNHACASRPARTPFPFCMLVTRYICCPMCRLHRVRHDQGVNSGDSALQQRRLTPTGSEASSLADNFFNAINIKMVSAAAEALAAACKQRRCKL